MSTWTLWDKLTMEKLLAIVRHAINVILLWFTETWQQVSFRCHEGFQTVWANRTKLKVARKDVDGLPLLLLIKMTDAQAQRHMYLSSTWLKELLLGTRHCWLCIKCILCNKSLYKVHYSTKWCVTSCCSLGCRAMTTLVLSQLPQLTRQSHVMTSAFVCLETPN